MKEENEQSEKADGWRNEDSTRDLGFPSYGGSDNPPSYESMTGFPMPVCDIGWRYTADDESSTTFISATLFGTNAASSSEPVCSPTPVYPASVFHPTLYPAGVFDADTDAQLLKSFSKGIFGTDEKAVVGVLGKRSLSQRLEICDAYRHRYKKNFEAKLSDKLRRAFFVRPVSYLSADLHDAAYHYEEHTTTNSDGSTSTTRHHRPIIRDIVEIVCSRTPNELTELARTYNGMHKTMICSDMKMATSGKLNTLLSLLLTNSRYPVPIDEKRLMVDVQRLAQCDGGTDDKQFIIHLFGTQSADYLKRLSTEYQQLSGKHITYVFRSYFSNYNRDALLTMHSCMYDRCSYFADATREAMTRRDFNTITRIVVCGCESDFGRVKEIYHQKYQKQFEDGVTKHASGAIKHLLLSFSGSPKY